VVREQIIKGEVPAGAFKGGKEVVFKRARARDVDFSNLVFATFTAERSEFERCEFESVTIRYGPLGLGGSVFRDCRFDRADLRGVDPGEARFERCSFDDAKIAEWMTHCAEFVGCRFATRIVGSVFSATPLNCSGRRKRNEFTGNDLSRAELIDTVFVGGIDLDEQKLPAGDEYIRIRDAAKRLGRARKAVEEWEDADERRLALVEIEVLGRFAEEQNDLFVRRVDADLPASVARRLWTLLE
jgi:Pentapeptide repeats (8 copies)